MAASLRAVEDHPQEIKVCCFDEWKDHLFDAQVFFLVS